MSRKHVAARGPSRQPRATRAPAGSPNRGGLLGRRAVPLPILGCVLGCFLVLSGCGESGRGGVPVSGTVRLDGAAMPAGSVVFVPLGEGHKAAAQVENGEFSISASEGPLPGAYRVEVYAPEVLDVPLDDPLAFAASAPRTLPPNPVAAQYNTQSTLRVNVQAEEENAFTFAVQSSRP